MKANNIFNIDNNNNWKNISINFYKKVKYSKLYIYLLIFPQD